MSWNPFARSGSDPDTVDFGELEEAVEHRRLDARGCA